MINRFASNANLFTTRGNSYSIVKGVQVGHHRLISLSHSTPKPAADCTCSGSSYKMAGLALQFLVVFGVVSGFVSSQCADKELVLVQAIYRHGDRSPIQAYPSDPYQESAWPQGFGQLTKTGRSQMFGLGQYIRQRYVLGRPYRLLSPTYDRLQLSVRATEVDRILVSAYCTLAGLFPPGNDLQHHEDHEGHPQRNDKDDVSWPEVWTDDAVWRPIPVYNPLFTERNQYLDNIAAFFVKEIRNVYADPVVWKWLQENGEFLDYVKNVTGSASFSLFDIFMVYDTLFCEKSNGKLLPAWTAKTWNGTSTYDKLGYIANLIYDDVFGTREAACIIGGTVTKVMRGNFEAKINGTSGRMKAYIYADHEYVVSTALNALRVFNNVEPPYASTVFLELHQSLDKYFVQVLYRNSTETPAQTLTIPGCDSCCPWETFVTLTDSWATECPTTK